jgi:hypothetical protein
MKANEKPSRKPNGRPAPNFGLRSFGERPLSLPEQKARARWKPPIPAMIADALAHNRGLLERLKGGMYAPDNKGKEQYQVIFNGLFATTKEQIAALELFARVDWE